MASLDTNTSLEDALTGIENLQSKLENYRVTLINDINSIITEL